MLTLYKIFKFIFRWVLPARVRYPLVRFIARGVCLFNRRRRAVIVGNLTPLVGTEQAAKLAPVLLGNFLMTAVDFFCPRTDIPRVTPFDNFNYLEKAYRKTKKVIAVTAHMGHWELGLPCLVYRGYPITGVYAPYRDDEVVNWIHKHRNNDVEWIPTTRGAVGACIDAVQRGRILGMVADIPFGEKGRRVMIAGRQTHLPLGPWAIAVRSGATVIPAFLLREKPGSYRIAFQDPIVPPTEGSFRKKMEYMQDIFKNHLEHYLLRYPTQWGVLQPFWDK
jgi:KDO2-lipid IV(A) lauroyltransferase